MLARRDNYAKPRARGNVDVRIDAAPPDEFQLRQTLQQRRLNFCSLPNEHENLSILKALHENIIVLNMVIPDSNLMAGELCETGQAAHGVEIVVEDCDLQMRSSFDGAPVREHAATFATVIYQTDRKSLRGAWQYYRAPQKISIRGRLLQRFASATGSSSTERRQRILWLVELELFYQRAIAWSGTSKRSSTTGGVREPITNRYLMAQRSTSQCVGQGLPARSDRDGSYRRRRAQATKRR